MKTAQVTVLAAAAAISACAPVVSGGPPLSLPPDLARSAHVGVIRMSSDWLQSEDDFTETFTTEIREELDQCLRGPETLSVRVHIDDLDRAGRLETLLKGDGRHALSGLVEFVDRAGTVVGRYPVSVATSAQGRVGGLLGDRQMMVSEEFGRALCEQVVGDYPRRSGPVNATRG